MRVCQIVSKNRQDPPKEMELHSIICPSGAQPKAVCIDSDGNFSLQAIENIRSMDAIMNVEAIHKGYTDGMKHLKQVFDAEITKRNQWIERLVYALEHEDLDYIHLCNFAKDGKELLKGSVCF